MADQGEFHFPGIMAVKSGAFTLSHGTTPSIATIETLPQASFIGQQGTLSITFGSTKIEFLDCRPSRAVSRQTSQGTVWTVTILDRRWKWMFGKISGHYNLSNQFGILRKSTEKSPQELATLCLKAMKETGYDISALPDKARPEVHWSYQNPAEALAQLCDSLGCRIVLGLDNKVRICKLGVGAALPAKDAMANDYTFDPPEKPDALEFVGGATQFQCRLILKPVGRDTDGKIKPIDGLSYTPAGGWKTVTPGYYVGFTRRAKKLAEDTVFRWYQIDAILNLDDGDESMKVPGFGKIESMEQLLPLDDVLVETYEDPQTKEKRPKPATISGIYQNGYMKPKNTPDDLKTADDADRSEHVQSFSIDKERGIVVFDEPIYRFKNSDSDQTTTLPAQLYLETSFTINDPKTGEPERFTKTRQLGNGGGPPRIVRQDEVVRTIHARYNNKAVVATINNLVPDKINENADYYLDAAQQEYQTTEASDVPYMGIVRIAPDGAIQQVTWEVGPGGASTRASRGSEHSVFATPYGERRRDQKTEDELRKAKIQGRAITAAAAKGTI